jgi:uncharacterized protein
MPIKNRKEMAVNKDKLPHRNLYTRIKASQKGVGLFAIRDIPRYTELFVGDFSDIVKVPVAEVEAIADLELRQMYIDFCPVVDDHFVAPSDFNQMTMSWYLNHSDTPNVAVDSQFQCTTSTLVAAGNELTADYRTYSGHASKYVSTWHSENKSGGVRHTPRSTLRLLGRWIRSKVDGGPIH